MGFGEPMVGAGQYLMVYAIIGVVVLAIAGWAVGIGLGGAILFAIAGGLFVIAMYFILRRVWNFFLHGSFSAGSSNSGGGDI